MFYLPFICNRPQSKSFSDLNWNIFILKHLELVLVDLEDPLKVAQLIPHTDISDDISSRAGEGDGGTAGLGDFYWISRGFIDGHACITAGT